ncbi:hypothetical protein [Hymenobacter latericus]|uniref:hypothetical protein n=1 Tax=Hymenobacter sp. YIM 151858-1 TaxID=2987688 RepID=UPI002227EDC4|nr:hypothetical protein [Hymenobacter sp. YIM 151858-1]UYZ61207.1 hypothetical protein OIS50_19755 [Hymenobacter sp. YIM 151858-1]
MKEVILPKKYFSILEKMNIPELLISFNPVIRDKEMVLRGNKDQFEHLVDIISDELSSNGFSSNSEPTEYGRALEILIDNLSFIYD